MSTPTWHLLNFIITDAMQKIQLFVQTVEKTSRIQWLTKATREIVMCWKKIAICVVMERLLNPLDFIWNIIMEGKKLNVKLWDAQ